MEKATTQKMSGCGTSGLDSLPHPPALSGALEAGVESEKAQTASIEASCSLIVHQVDEVDRNCVRNSIIINAMMMVMESSSSESEAEEENIIRLKLRSDTEVDMSDISFMCERNPRNSVKHYFEQTVQSYTEKEFRSHFRISRSLFENLSERLLQWEFYKNLRADKRIPESVYMLVFLWFAGHEACSFRDLADRFNLSILTICLIIDRTSIFLSSLSPEIIKWPTELQKEESSNFFDKKCLFSKAIGCIDGTHIVIDPPRKAKDDYIDRKGTTTICMEAICNENKKFINIFVGYAGSCHDSWVLKYSPVYDKLPSYCGDYYLLGDSAYPCNKYLITPYRDNGHLTSAQKLFNIKLSSGRVAIEHTFGILKQRFRQLYYCKLRGMKKICHFVRACCVLHNIANEDDLEFAAETTPELNEEFPDHGEVSRGNCARDVICQSMQRRRNENVA